LSVSHGIVERHRGTIDVTSEPGRGTTFRIRLPIRRAETSESESVSETATVGQRA
jgi:signal transduction histidine kinase